MTENKLAKKPESMLAVHTPLGTAIIAGTKVMTDEYKALMVTAADRMAAARLRVVVKEPFLTSGMFRLRFYALPGCGTAACDAKGRVIYDPAAIAGWTVEEVAGVLVHELWHILNEHQRRCGNRDPKHFNLAGDLAINGPMAEAGWKLPNKPMLAAQLGLPEGQLAEEYYELLPRQSGQGGDGQGGQGKGKSKSDPGTPGPGNGQCGGAAGNPHEWEDEVDQSGDAPEGLDASERQIMQREVANDIAEHVRKNGRGTMPGQWAAWADEQLAPPKVDWREVLAQRVRKAAAYAMGQSDFTYSRVNRRMAVMGQFWGGRAPIMPTMHRPIPKVVAVLDTSGSMSGGPLQKALSEIMGIVQALGMPLESVAVDAAIQAITKVGSVGDLKRLNRGGGGTDMRIGIDWAASKKADVIVVLTDGFTPWPDPGEMPHGIVVPLVIGDTEVPEHVGRVVRVALEDLK